MSLFAKTKALKSAAEEETSTAAGVVSRVECFGPWDSTRFSREQLSAYVDFGCLLVPRHPGLAVHPEEQLGDNAFRALTVQLGRVSAELMVVAAPKSRGLWEEIRGEIIAETTKQGNTSEEVAGSFGVELKVLLAVETSDGQRGYLPLRYVGVDGPNWFMRVIFNGAVAENADDMQALEAVLRKFIVVRGSQPLTPRSVVPVVLADDLVKQLAQLQERVSAA